MSFQVAELKDKGNAALQADQLEEAIRAYTEAIQIDAANEILYSNRSAAYAKNAQYDLALKDAEKAVEIKPVWGKVCSIAFCVFKPISQSINQSTKALLWINHWVIQSTKQ